MSRQLGGRLERLLASGALVRMAPSAHGGGLGPSPPTYVADLPPGVGWTDPLKRNPIDHTSEVPPRYLAAISCMYRLLK